MSTNKKPGFRNSGQNNQFSGYDVDIVRYQKRFFGLLPHKAIYRFTLDLVNPLYFVHPSGLWYMPGQPGESIETDWGSVPPIGQILIPKDRYLMFLLHDYGYAKKGLWISFDQGASWDFTTLSREQLDDLLSIGIRYDPLPGSARDQRIVYRAVRLFGWISYGKGDLRKKKAA